MLQEDFYNYDGDVSKVLIACGEWIKKEEPRNPIVVIVQQNDSYIHIAVFYQ